MSKYRRLLHWSAAVALTALSFSSVIPVAAAGAVIVVNTTSNGLGDGKCSFEEAVAAANTNTAQDGGACTAGSGLARDTIKFKIGSGAKTITIASYVDIDDPVFIDGSSQGGYAGIPLIKLTTSDAGLLRFLPGSDGSGIRALKLANTFAGPGMGYAVLLDTSSSFSATGNYFNTDGTAVDGNNAWGIILFPSANTVIGGTTAAARNLFGGSGGVRIDGGGNNTIQGNYFGVRRDGITALTGLPVNDAAVTINPFAAASSGNVIRRNVITGFYEGVYLVDPSTGNTVAGNLIGVGVDGTTPLPNGNGVDIFGSDANTIGGPTAVDRNIIVSMSSASVMLTAHSSAVPDNNVIEGNYIGVNASGSSAIGPGAIYGVLVSAGDGNFVGMNGAGNVISGNDYGIRVDGTATGTRIRGNRIGTDAAGLSAIPNTQVGIYLVNAPGNIGDATTPGNNLISGNAAGSSIAGVRLDGAGTTGTTIFGNRIGINGPGNAALPNDYGIVMAGGGPAQVAQNWVGGNAGYSLLLDATSNAAANSRDNCFTGNGPSGLTNLNVGVSAPFTFNWWGDTSGPHNTPSNPSGTGDEVSDHVDFSSWLPIAPVACSVLQNASFEFDANGDKRPDNWKYAYLVGATDKRDCASSVSYTCSLTIKGNGNPKSATQSILMSGGASDQFSFSLRSAASSVPAGAKYRLQVKFLNGTTVLSNNVMNFSVGTHGYELVSGTFTAPGPYTKIVYKIIYKAPSGIVWFDDATLSRLP